MHLGTDAFVEWENTFWDEDGRSVCRGVIATPFVIRAFQIDVDELNEEGEQEHSPEKCGTFYASEEEDDMQNPVSGMFHSHMFSSGHLTTPKGLFIHPPALGSPKPPTPNYTLTRLSATPTTTTWYQQTDCRPSPQWTNTLYRKINLSIPTAAAAAAAAGAGGIHAMLNDDDDDDDDENEDEDSDDNDGLNSVDDNRDEGDELTLPGGARELAGESGVDDAEVGAGKKKKTTTTTTTTTTETMTPYRARIWGLAASPAAGVQAAVVSEYLTTRPERDSGVLSKVVFGWVPQHESPSLLEVAGEQQLSTEGRAWEWMYGGGAVIPFKRQQTAAATIGVADERVERVRMGQRCVYCSTGLERVGFLVRCERGHGFGLFLMPRFSEGVADGGR